MTGERRNDIIMSTEETFYGLFRGHCYKDQNMPNIIEITDFEAPELDVYARLTEAQLLNRQEPENALFIAESPNVILRALDAGCVPVSMLLERKHITGQAAEVGARC